MNARWDPFRDALSLREAMDRLLEQSVVSPREGRPGGPTSRGGRPLPIDMWETADSLVVRAPLPGARADDQSLDVSVEGNVLTIRAQILAGADEEREEAGQAGPTGATGQTGPAGQVGRGVRWIVREIPRGEVSRVVELPAQVDADRASARFVNGMLELTLPKVQTARARRINVTPG
ncbi:MAG: Hsp20/alpha crystallin family protein [Chloroflexota bacterium]|nr:Hsp20/alpha crystallin family protein [Chloroflexota bacterium]